MTLTWILLAPAALLLLLTLAPLCTRKEWWIRGWEFPRLQLAGVALLLIVLSPLQFDGGRPLTWIPPAVALGCFIWQSVRIYPFTKLRRVEVGLSRSPEEARTLKLVIANVRMDNRETDRLLDLVTAEAPDMLLALEGNARWGEALSVLKPHYPHTVEKPLENTFGMHFYSKLPIAKSQINYLVEEDVPSFSIQIRLRNSATVQLYCVHPPPPSPTENEESTERDRELIIVGRRSADCPHPVIIAGDLNDVAWSRTTRRFRRISGLLDPRVGRGFYNTYHAKVPIARWPLDHVFHSPDFRLVRLERLPAIGSDHFPILAELELTRD